MTRRRWSIARTPRGWTAHSYHRGHTSTATFPTWGQALAYVDNRSGKGGR